jgi:hypothetical protein
MQLPFKPSARGSRQSAPILEQWSEQVCRSFPLVCRGTARRRRPGLARGSRLPGYSDAVHSSSGKARIRAACTCCSRAIQTSTYSGTWLAAPGLRRATARLGLGLWDMSGLPVARRRIRQVDVHTMTAIETRRRDEGIVFVALFGLTIPAANWLIGPRGHRVSAGLAVASYALQRDLQMAN